MEPIPPEIKILFDAILVEVAIPKESHFHYRKWLRYYLDFCLKYNFIPSSEESLPHYIKRLRDKKQTTGHQKQASHAIALYYELESKLTGKRKPFKNKNTSISSKKIGLKDAGADWRPIYHDLDSEIKLRHYSPKTLSA